MAKASESSKGLGTWVPWVSWQYILLDATASEPEQEEHLLSFITSVLPLARMYTLA